MLDFIHQFKSVTLATVDDEFFPHASYAPYVHYKHKYYVFISQLAKHTKNLEVNSDASLLFLEDESTCETVFARKRISLLCDSNAISRDTELFATVMDQFRARFDSDMIETLISMGDFQLYEFTPQSGEAVFGFGKAYDLGGQYCEELMARRSSDGHQRS